MGLFLGPLPHWQGNGGITTEIKGPLMRQGPWGFRPPTTSSASSKCATVPILNAPCGRQWRQVDLMMFLNGQRLCVKLDVTINEEMKKLQGGMEIKKIMKKHKKRIKKVEVNLVYSA